MQYGKSEIINRLKEGKELGYTDLENTPSYILADVVLAFDTILWEKTKGTKYRETLKQIGESLESFWEEEC